MCMFLGEHCSVDGIHLIGRILCIVQFPKSAINDCSSLIAEQQQVSIYPEVACASYHSTPQHHGWQLIGVPYAYSTFHLNWEVRVFKFPVRNFSWNVR